MSHLNNYYESPADYDPMEITIRPAVFLAGGITGCPDWQAHARRLINNSGLVVDILNPRRVNFPIDDPAARWEQVSWEQRHLHTDGVHTMFWFPASDHAVTTQPIAMFELGQAIGEGRSFNVGTDPDYPRRTDVEMLCRLNLPDLAVQNTLADTVSIMLGKIFRKGNP